MACEQLLSSVSPNGIGISYSLSVYNFIETYTPQHAYLFRFNVARLEGDAADTRGLSIVTLHLTFC